MGWIVYILTCSDGTYYTGITNDLTRRLAQHQAGTASRYTRSRLPVSLAASAEVSSKSKALKTERRIKALPRQKKLGFLLSC